MCSPAASARQRQATGCRAALGRPADLDLAATEIELVDAPRPRTVLRKALDQLAPAAGRGLRDHGLPPRRWASSRSMHRPPLRKSSFPCSRIFLALQGLSKLFETTSLVKRRLNRELKITGIILCLYETATRLAQDITAISSASWIKAIRSLRGNRPKSSPAASAGTSNWRKPPALAKASSIMRRKAPARSTMKALVQEVLASESAQQRNRSRPELCGNQPRREL